MKTCDTCVCKPVCMDFGKMDGCGHGLSHWRGDDAAEIARLTAELACTKSWTQVIDGVAHDQGALAGWMARAETAEHAVEDLTSRLESSEALRKDTYRAFDDEKAEVLRLRGYTTKLTDEIHALRKDAARLIADRDRYASENKKLMFESVSDRCRRTHCQSCHLCDDLGCGDNTSKWAEERARSAAVVEAARKAIALGHNDDCMFCGFKDKALTAALAQRGGSDETD